MEIKVHIQDRVEPISDEWEDLAASLHAAPFLWPAWTQAWWRAFGSGRLRILAAYRDGELSGVLPLRRLRSNLGSTTNAHTPLFGLLASDEEVASHLARALFAQSTAHVELSHLSASDANLGILHEAASSARYRLLERSMQASPYVATDGDWERYEGGLRRKLRSELRRRRRRLEEEGRLDLEVLDGGENLEALLEEGFRIEGSGWKEASGTSINSEPRTRRFYAEVARWAARRGWLRLAFLRLDGKAIAFDYALEHEGVHYLLKTGYDPAFGRFAPGMILRHMMLLRAFSGDIHTYDFLGEDYPWKHEWTNAWQEHLFLQMFAPTALGLANRLLFSYDRPDAGRAKRIARSLFEKPADHPAKRPDSSR